MNSLTEISEKLLKTDSVLIFSHSRPDGDTLGSSMALYLALKGLNKRVGLVCADDIPKKFSFLETCVLYKKPCEIQEEYSLHISVDCSTETMFSDCNELYFSKISTINVDHHVSNSLYASYNYVEDRGACAEIIYKLLECMRVKITPEIANCLLLGICTDTGSYMHSNVTDGTLSISSKLVTAGGNLHLVAEKMFKTQSVERAKLYASVISEMKFALDNKFAYIVITGETLNKYNATRDLTEGFIDFPLSVEGVEVAASFLEVKSNCYKISFRSRGRVNVNEIASLYGGGGHILASGAMLNGSIYEILDRITFDIKQRI